MAVTVANVSGIIQVTLSASGDTATPQNIINAGFGTIQGVSTIVTSNKIMLRIAQGAVFDSTGWNWIISSGGSLRLDESYGTGIWRCGWKLVSSTWVKVGGGTIQYVNFDGSNNAGGRSVGFGTTAPPGFPTNKPILHWNDVTWSARPGTTNGSAKLEFNYASFGDTATGLTCGHVFMDHLGDGNGVAANAAVKSSFGFIDELSIAYANSGLSTGSGVTTEVVQVGKLNYFGLYFGNNQVNTKFDIPNNLPLRNFAPVIISPTTNEFWGFFTAANFNKFFDDPVFPTTYNALTKHRVYQVQGVTNLRRLVTFDIKDSTGAALTNTTLRITSGATELVNAVQAGNYSTQTPYAILRFTTNAGDYRAPNVTDDYRNQTYRARKSGFIEQNGSYNIEFNAYSSPLFMLPDPAYGSVTPAAAALVTGVTPNYVSQVLQVSESRNLDEVYGFTGHSLALTANTQYANFRSNVGGAFILTSPWSMQVTGGDLSMGAYNTKISGSKPLTVTAGSLTLGTEECVWTPSVYADMPTFANGGTFNLPEGSQFTIRPTVSLGFSSTTMFGLNTNWNMTDSTIEFDMGAINDYNGSIFSAFTSNNTCVVNFNNATWTINGTGTGTMNPFTHLYWAPNSVINGLTINGTQAQNFTLNMSTAPIKLTGLSAACILTGSLTGAPTVPLDTYTYTGPLSAMKTTLGRQTKWSFLDAARSDGAVFRWDAGATPTGTDGYYGVLHFRPTINVGGTGYTPTVRLTPSVLASRYPVKTFSTTAESTVALSNFYQDSTMSGSDGSLPFVDSLDDKSVQNIINWTVDFRKAGFLDQTRVFAGATAKKGLVTYTASGVVDSNYVNASTAAADALLISINTSTKTIDAVSGTLSWSPQRLYNALKNWWATYASDVDFLATSSGGVLRLGDYNVSANISFAAPASGDAFVGVSTTGLINALVNDIAVNDSRGTSTIWQFQSVTVGSSIALWDATGATVFYQGNVTTAGTYSKYLPAASSGTYSYAVERYGSRREEGTFPATQGGVLFFVPDYNEDVGISQTTKATVEAYTTIENADKFYDRTALFRLTEQGIKLGQIATRDGDDVRVNGYNMVINQSASSVYALSGSTITLKATGYANGTKFTNTVLDSNKTLTANTNEVLSADFEDANGNSALTILGGDGTFELWKVTTASATADYATGTKLTSPTVGNVKFRFTGVTGFDIVGVDINSNVRRRTSMAKGVYTQSFYVGEQIQVAQAPAIDDINEKVDLMQVDLEAIKGTGFVKDKHSLVPIKKKAALAAALSA